MVVGVVVGVVVGLLFWCVFGVVDAGVVGCVAFGSVALCVGGG